MRWGAAAAVQQCPWWVGTHAEASALTYCIEFIDCSRFGSWMCVTAFFITGLVSTSEPTQQQPKHNTPGQTEQHQSTPHETPCAARLHTPPQKKSTPLSHLPPLRTCQRRHAMRPGSRGGAPSGRRLAQAVAATAERVSALLCQCSAALGTSGERRWFQRRGWGAERAPCTARMISSATTPHITTSQGRSR